MEHVYLDHNATTPVRDEVLEVLSRVSRDVYANPSSLHFPGRRAKIVLDESREELAGVLGVNPAEIVFTSGGTESNNLAIKGMAAGRPGGHIITSAIEHPAVLDTCRFLEKHGYSLTVVPVDRDGRVDPAAVEAAVRENTILISIMWVNNETGVIQPVERIGDIAGRHDIPFHADAVQAFGKIPLEPGQAPVDMVSISGHKIYAPKGVGALYVRRKLRPQALIHGGGQEKNMRSGTENLPGIAALARAATLASADQPAEAARLATLRDDLETRILSGISHCWINGREAERVANTSSLTFDGTEGEAVLVGLDEYGVAASSASACSAAHADPSHVLQAMGLSRTQAEATIRFSFGRLSRGSDVDRVINVLSSIIQRLRALTED